jgi:hypothetical protein
VPTAGPIGLESHPHALCGKRNADRCAGTEEISQSALGDLKQAGDGGGLSATPIRANIADGGLLLRNVPSGPANWQFFLDLLDRFYLYFLRNMAIARMFGRNSGFGFSLTLCSMQKASS